MSPYANGLAGGTSSASPPRRSGPPPGNSRQDPTAASVGMMLDNILRNQLKVSDPRDPKQVADGLLATPGRRQHAGQ